MERGIKKMRVRERKGGREIEILIDHGEDDVDE